MKAYAVRGFVQGVELSLLESTHYFIYAMLAYRLVELLQTGHTQFNDFQGIFRGSSQKGIDSLVQSLAKIEAKWLKLILATPFLIGALQSIAAMYSARSTSSETQQETFTKLKTRLSQENGCRHSLVLEEIPLLNQHALGSEIQKLERWVRWDGRLNRDSRKQAFELIRRAAWAGKKVTQLKALESLAKIAQGIGLKDFPRLRRAGYSTEELTELLWIKTTALTDLELLSRQTSVRHSQFNPQQRATSAMISLPRRVYASYLLWWLGQAISWWTQRLPFTFLKIAKLGLEALFLQKIINSIIEAINCPDKPGYQFGDGYQDWASDYTAKCFNTRISLFRTINFNESVAALVLEIPQYHLTELTSLDLTNKYLTTDEASQIIQAIVQQGASLTSLDLYSNQLNVIDEDIFKGLSQLKDLNLGHSQLSILSDDVFNGLSQLKSLDLSFNRLTTVGDRVFSGLDQLESLYLHSNQLTTLSEGVFNRLSQLQSLSLGYNQLNTLSNDVFSGLSQLETLEWEYNQITTLNDGVFSGLSQLLRLDLDGNQLITLSESVFDGLSQLWSLDLEYNHFTTLSDGVFSGLSQLRYLYLNGNQLITFNNGVFSGLSQLWSLDLGYNYLATLSDGVFSELNQLEILSLSNNGLTILSEKVFDGLKQLQYLILKNNSLNTSIMVTLLSQLPSSLLELDISSNLMDYIPKNFSTLLPALLQTLSIGGAYVPETLTREFMQNFPLTLTSFSITYSSIVNITATCFLDFSMMTILDVSYNQINSLNNGVFYGLGQLESLHLYGNQLTTLSDDVFSGLSQLHVLDLTSNRLTTLSDGVFSGLSQLEYLMLQSNRLITLSKGVFGESSQLQVLELSWNQLNSLSDSMFSGLSQLEALDLISNRLTTLSDGVFSGLGQLQTLELDGNRLTTLSHGVFNQLSQLQSLDLSANQLNDTAIKNLTQNFPYQLNSLDVSYNQIGNEGALALTEILPCTNLTSVDFSNNPANDTTVALAAQQNALRKVCEDQRCHANLLATESCPAKSSSTGSFTEIDENAWEIPAFFEGFTAGKSLRYHWPCPMPLTCHPLSLQQRDL